MRGLIGQKPVIYFTDKPIENLKILSLFYTSNKLHSLTVYQRYNQLLGVQEKSLWITHWLVTENNFYVVLTSPMGYYAGKRIESALCCLITSLLFVIFCYELVKLN